MHGILHLKDTCGMSSPFNLRDPEKKHSGASIGARSRQDVVVLTSNGERKFIGGAEKARRIARQGGNRIMRPDEKQRLDQRIPARLNPFERFYAGMLRSTAEDFLSSKDTWRTICQRLGLPVPESPLPAVYPDGKQHFFYRAALVIEEARYSVAEGLAMLDREYKKKSKNNQRLDRQYGNHSLSVKLHGLEQNDKTGHSVLIFVAEKAFRPDHLDALRTGTVFACCPVSAGRDPTLSLSILASILPSNRDDMISEKKIGVMIFSGNIPRTADWVLTPLTNLISQQRMYEACTSKDTTKVPFLHPLLGGKASTHTRFDEGPDGSTAEAARQDDPGQEEGDEIVPWEKVRKVFSIPQLNATQERAARSYLRAEANTITLVQGPPGSGKTMLLVSVICRYVMESIQRGISRSLMICAPTNKAVSVLCCRFMDALNDGHKNLPCNVVLIGDEDKLVGDGYGSDHKHWHSSETTPLRSIFLYTWIQTVLVEYGRIKNHLTAKRNSHDLRLAMRLSKELQRRISRSLSLSKSLNGQMRELTNALEEAAEGNLVRRNVALSTVEDILLVVGQWKNEDIWHELLGSANLIFCTLASSGASIVKKSIRAVNDLIVDEAAAATEPEIYIPFQYRPERLLAVGDPKQLPATVLSRVAEDRGMSRSLHERLMFDCNHKYTMLDVQYRMRPDLSQFPSKAFYNAELVNGPNVIRSDYRGAVSLLDDRPYSFLQISGDERQSHSGSFENPAEADAIANIVVDLQRLSRKIPGSWYSPERIRIITFYQAQVSLIKQKLHQRNCSQVLVATVDSSQGCEADIVIVSFVRSTRRDHRETVGFLSDDRRLNVAITRGQSTFCFSMGELKIQAISLLCSIP
jgi:AAA domain